MNETPPILQAKKIAKKFFYPQACSILKDISLEVREGVNIAITGSSGCGKSTLLKILGTLENPTRGQLFYQGKKLSPKLISTIRNQYCGMIFQSGNLLEEYSLLYNLLIKAQIFRKPTQQGTDSHRQALHLLDLVGLSHRQSFPVKYLSGGEKQRAAIARALMNDPKLILADEPTGNLDQCNAQQIQEIFIHGCQKLQKSLILVTHDQKFAEKMEIIFHLEDGLIQKIQ